MIRQIQLDPIPPGSDRPSKSKLKYLQLGDIITASSNSEEVLCNVLWVYGDDVVAKILSENNKDFPAGTIITLDKEFIVSIEAPEAAFKLPKFVTFRDEKTNEDYVMHTKWPRFIGKVTYSYQVKINGYVMLEPADIPEADFQKILTDAADWMNYRGSQNKSTGTDNTVTSGVGSGYLGVEIQKLQPSGSGPSSVSSVKILNGSFDDFESRFTERLKRIYYVVLTVDGLPDIKRSNSIETAITIARGQNILNSEGVKVLGIHAFWDKEFFKFDPNQDDQEIVEVLSKLLLPLEVITKFDVNLGV